MRASWKPVSKKVEDQLGVDNLYEAANTPLIGFLNNAIKAKELYHRDDNYIVQGGEVMIVDEHTGRVLSGRRYNDGMHQAIEAKEGVEIKAENQTLATVTLQNYFRLYPEGSRAGMTGTAETEAAEFASTYKIGVIPIPTPQGDDPQRSSGSCLSDNAGQAECDHRRYCRSSQEGAAGPCWHNIC
jgi:preprotein translocase subunit SecA